MCGGLSRSSSSGSISQRSSSGQSEASSEESGVNYPLEGLSKMWDAMDSIRDRLREGYPLLLHYDPKDKKLVVQVVQKTRHNCKANADVISPVLGFVKRHGGAVPCIDNLMYEVDLFYKKSKSSLGSAERLYQDGWAIRRLVAVVKAATYKPYQPQDWVGTHCHHSLLLVVSIALYPLDL